MGNNVTQALTANEAYRAMFSFLEELYQRTHSDELAVLLGSLSLLDDGQPADPAMWHAWEQAVSRALADKDLDRMRFDR